MRKMNWNKLISTRRLGSLPPTDENDLYNRTQFQRDYDRMIFSSPFRRMQNKTQVFPLPGSIFVHNRLTHSLEVASVGRTLGNMLADRLAKQGENHPLLAELGAVVSAGCLAHDMGNPPFGHAGEEAISNYFTNGNGQDLKSRLSEGEWNDFVYFDGNANALRLLSHQFQGRRDGGFALTYTTLSSIVKYPYESVGVSKPKFGFFQSEKELYRGIADELGLESLSAEPLKFVRHPLVYLVEAADDICYQIMDMEDAHKLGIVSYDTVIELFRNFYDCEADKTILSKMEKNFKIVTDKNERVAYLRASVINKLVKECVEVFEQNQDSIMNGSFNTALIKMVTGSSKAAMDVIGPMSVEKIYRDRSVIEIEVAGYKILGTLLDELIQAVLTPKAGLSRRLLSLIPDQYRGEHQSDYEKIQSVVDYVSGMTDLFALDLYRKIKGISLPGIG